MNRHIKQYDEKKQVSMTGARALVMLVSLLEGPKSFEEIRQFFIDCGIVDKQYSIDTIRIDINTLKMVGCKISKATKRNNHKYGLVSHPFVLKITNDEVSALKSVYRKISKTASPKKLLDYHKLFQKLAGMVDKRDTNIIESILGISLLKNIDTTLLESILAGEQKRNKVRLLYNPAGKEECLYDITVEKLGVRNDKLYVFCYNHTLGVRSFLKLDRIKAFICNMFDNESGVGLDTIVTFQLKNFSEYELEETETILEQHGDYVLVRGRYFNDFIATQRMLNLTPDCIILESEEIKENVVNKLREMRLMYA